MFIAHKIRLNSTRSQERFFQQSADVARFAYNWALTEWEKEYELGRKPNAYSLSKKLNAIKLAKYPWMLRVSCRVPQQAIKNVGKAFDGFFRGLKNGESIGYPTFKKKLYSKSSFRSDNGPTGTSDALNIDGKKVKVPRLGWVKMSEEVRFNGKIVNSIISKTASQWFISIIVDTNDVPHVRKNHGSCGIDLGCTNLAVLDSGRVYNSAKALSRNLRKLQRMSKQHSRKQKGSSNKRKSVDKLAKLYYRISCLRSDALHKATTDIVLNNVVIALEDLNVKEMIKTKLAKLVMDSSFYEFRRQVSYKSKMYKSTLLFVDRFFPSTKLCMSCGQKWDMPLGKRVFKCDCGEPQKDRDVHAAQNIIAEALRKFTPLEMKALACNSSQVKLLSLNEEFIMTHNNDYVKLERAVA